MSLNGSIHDDCIPPEAAEWQGTTRLPGDYYQEPDTVLRGVTLGSSAEAPVAGDYYGDFEETCRGITIDDWPREDFGLSLDGSCYKPQGIAITEPAPHVEPWKPSKVACRPNEGPGVQCRFEQDARASDMPPDPWFRLEPTTVHISCDAPCEIGNCLIDFLEHKMQASVSKDKDVCLKAKVFLKDSLAPNLDFSMCSVKVRVYTSEQARRWPTEFSRRSGCSMVFSCFYRQACEWLQSRFPGIQNLPEALHHPLCPPLPDGDMEDLLEGSALSGGEADLQPLYDMAAAAAHCPSLQADFAAAFAGLAEDTQRVPLLCTDRAFGEIEKLLQSSRTEVAYPTARVLSALAKCPQAEKYFVKKGFLASMAGKAVSSSTCALVQRHTAEALSWAVDKYAQQLHPEDAKDLAKELAEKLQDVPVGAAARPALEEASACLKLPIPAC
mmetsp:Transcript_10273/g.23165  ORF Transcript_10273/g.23165 Transcript_10273/m.23165 type:complete len:441 (-) Transcript_10273:58-1380(-)